LLYIRASITGSGPSGVTFNNIISKYNSNIPTTGYGGVMYINRIAQLTMTSVIASDFIVKQTTATNGGGRFLYLNPTDSYQTTIIITNSQFACSSTAFTQTTQISNNVQLSIYD
jgi:hypothetical protein